MVVGNLGDGIIKAENKAAFTAKEDDGIGPIVVQEIEFTDLR